MPVRFTRTDNGSVWRALLLPPRKASTPEGTAELSRRRKEAFRPARFLQYKHNTCGTCVHQSIIPSAVVPMLPVDLRASAYGIFTAGFGLFWLLGSVIIDLLYEWTIVATIVSCVAMQLAATPVFLVVRRQHEKV